jgi:threonine/homoserine/homoserine lactone efflux protein
MTVSFSLIMAAWITLATAAIFSDPNLVAVASRGLGSGRKSALIVALGLVFGGFGWPVLTAVGHNSLCAAFPILLRILGVIGGAYLGWFGFKGWRAPVTGKGGQITPAEGHGSVSEFFHSLAVTATNPKVALLWASAINFCRISDQLVAYALAIYSWVYGDHVLHRWHLRSDILNGRRPQGLQTFSAYQPSCVWFHVWYAWLFHDQSLYVNVGARYFTLSCALA